MYLTGGIGSRHRDEAFGDPFELPPDVAYNETCAAIASVMLAGACSSRPATSAMPTGSSGRCTTRSSAAARSTGAGSPTTTRFSAGQIGRPTAPIAAPDRMEVVRLLPAEPDAHDQHLAAVPGHDRRRGRPGPPVRVGRDRRADWRGCGPTRCRHRVSVGRRRGDHGRRDARAAMDAVGAGTCLVRTGDAARVAELATGRDHRSHLRHDAASDAARPARRCDPRNGGLRARSLRLRHRERRPRRSRELEDLRIRSDGQPTTQAREDIAAGVVIPAEAPDGAAVAAPAIPYFAWGNRDDGAMRVWIPEATDATNGRAAGPSTPGRSATG